MQVCFRAQNNVYGIFKTSLFIRTKLKKKIHQKTKTQDVHTHGMMLSVHTQNATKQQKDW